jgi:cytochrome P450
MKPVFGDSAFMLHDDEEHSSVRDAIVPAFHNRVVQSHAAMIADAVDHELSSWPAETVCTLSPYLKSLTLKIMLLAAIDVRDEHEHTVCQPLRHTSETYETLSLRMREMLSVMATPLLQQPRLRHLPGWRRAWKRFQRRRQAVAELLDPLISSRRRADTHPGQRDLLGLLIAARNPDGFPLSDRQVSNNLISVIVAGHETTAATLAWIFQLLAHNPTVQDRLINEIDSGTGDTYLNAVIQETLRHKPAFLFLPPRVVMKPVDVGGYHYNPPAWLLACTYLLHHDPEFYANPHTFMPERFVGEPPRPGTLLPWGLGRKRCPGRQFALIEIRSVLRRALSAWYVLPAKDRIEYPRWQTALLTPHAGSKVILHRRQGSHHGCARGASA